MAVLVSLADQSCLMPFNNADCIGNGPPCYAKHFDRC